MVPQPDPPPAVAAARPLVEAYGAGGFRVRGARIEGPVLISSVGVWPWMVDGLAAATVVSLGDMLDGGAVEILLLGCGASMAPPPAALRAALEARRIRLEPMTTGAACRTFNVLVAERRPVGAALLAV